jgi:hypothetical protein
MSSQTDNLDAQVVYVRKQLSRDGRRVDLKTKAARRELPLAAIVVQVLRVHRAAQ